MIGALGNVLQAVVSLGKHCGYICISWDKAVLRLSVFSQADPLTL